MLKAAGLTCCPAHMSSLLSKRQFAVSKSCVRSACTQASPSGGSNSKHVLVVSVLNMRQQWMLRLRSCFVQVGTCICFCKRWDLDILL